MKRFVAINFYEVEEGHLFRYNRRYWKRTQQNHAVLMENRYGLTQHFDTVAKVGISKTDLPKDVKPIDLSQFREKNGA